MSHPNTPVQIYENSQRKTQENRLDMTILYGRMILLAGRQDPKIPKPNKVLGLDKPISIV
jgi:hypothetical protein